MLIQCKECNHEVSNKAVSCPNCGARIKKQGGGCLKPIAIGVGLIVLLGMWANSAADAERKEKVGRHTKLNAEALKEVQAMNQDDIKALTAKAQGQLGLKADGILGKNTCSYALGQEDKPKTSSIRKVAVGLCGELKNDPVVAENARKLALRNDKNKGHSAMYTCEMYLERSMKNPDSYDRVDYSINQFTNLASKYHHSIKIKYRATNSFNAVITDTAQCLTGDNMIVLNGTTIYTKPY